MTTPTLDTIRPSWERTMTRGGVVRPVAVQAPSRRFSKRDGADNGETLALRWENIDDGDYSDLLAVYEAVGNNLIVAFTPADEAAPRGWRIKSFNPRQLTGQNYQVELTIKSVPGSVIT